MKYLKDLIAKYSSNGPRYTSYPTAPHFSASVDKEKLVELAVSGKSDLSLYIHIPFCRSICKFCGCSTSVCSDEKKCDEYLDFVRAELELWRKKGLSKRKVFQVHMGGGTPNFLSPEQIIKVRGIFDEFFELQDSDSNFEFSVELDPRTLTPDKVKAFAKIGMNRASLGIQDVDSKVQKAIGRIQPPEKNFECAEWLRSSGVDKINADLIYGLPLQTKDSFAASLEHVKELSPTRISLFGYAHVPWIKAAQKGLEKFGFPSSDERVEIFLESKLFLENLGYEFIGLDHFALKGDPLIEARRGGSLHRNFQGYTTHAGLDTFALGLTSISDTRVSYRQNFKDTTSYFGSISRGELPLERGIILNDDDLLRRAVIMDVMCSTKVSYENYGVDFKSVFSGALEKLKSFEEDGLVSLREGGFSVTPTGRLFLRNIAMLFDGRLSLPGVKYSKTL